MTALSFRGPTEALSENPKAVKTFNIYTPYPGTELYDFAVRNGFLVPGSMVDDDGHQLAHIEYPNLPAEEILSAVHQFYDEYYFRPKVVARIVKGAVFNKNDRKRLYKEAREFLATRARRRELVKAGQV